MPTDDQKAKAADRWRWLAAVTFDGALSPVQCRVAFALFTYINSRSGKAWPSYGRLAEDLQLSRRTVIEAIRELGEDCLGYLAKQRTGGGRGHTNTWTLAYDRVAYVERWRAQISAARRTVSPAERVQPGAGKGANGSRETVRHGAPELVDGEPVEKNLLKPLPGGRAPRAALQGEEQHTDCSKEWDPKSLVEKLLSPADRQNPAKVDAVKKELDDIVAFGNNPMSVCCWIIAESSRGRPPALIWESVRLIGGFGDFQGDQSTGQLRAKFYAELGRPSVEPEPKPMPPAERGPSVEMPPLPDFLRRA